MIQRCYPGKDKQEKTRVTTAERTFQSSSKRQPDRPVAKVQQGTSSTVSLDAHQRIRTALNGFSQRLQQLHDAYDRATGERVNGEEDDSQEDDDENDSGEGEAGYEGDEDSDYEDA